MTFPVHLKWALLCGIFAMLLAQTNAIRAEDDDDTLKVDVESKLTNNQKTEVEMRLPSFEESLRSLFGTLPKNEKGELGPTATRYALDRMFRRTRAWSVKGLAPTGHLLNASASPAKVLEQREELSRQVESIFEQHLTKDGFSLADVSLLAATIDEVIQEEAIKNLKMAYEIQELSLVGSAPWDDVVNALDVYIMIFIGNTLGDVFHVRNPVHRSKILEVYPNWHSVQRFVRKLVRDVIHVSSGPLSFADAEKAVKEISAQFGKWQDNECRELKHTLVGMEGRCPARVELGDFHGSSLHDNKWQFTESADYLRQLGCLDESNPQRPSVIIPNYIDSVSNVIATNDMFSVVCLDECEDVKSRIEAQIGGPSATPDEIAAAVKLIPSESVTTPRSISASLMQRLNMIAKYHEGRVPLHGRLFSQWLHHAYPHECPYPASPGSMDIKFPNEMPNVVDIVATKDEVQKSEADLEQAHKSARTTKEIEECLPWTMEEELVAPLVSSDEVIAERRLLGGETLTSGSITPFVTYPMLALPLLVVSALAVTRYFALSASKNADPLLATELTQNTASKPSSN